MDQPTRPERRHRSVNTARRCLIQVDRFRRRGLSPDQVNDAIHLYHLGWSLTRVGEHLNVHHTTVLTKLRERAIPTRDPHGRP
jgi:hypothetical protein